MSTSSEKREKTAIEVYKTIIDATESIEEGNLGANLAYLMGAILMGEDFDAYIEHHGAFIALLFNELNAAHPVWQTILLNGDNGPLSAEVQAKLLAGTLGTLGNVNEEDCPAAGPWHRLFQSQPKEDDTLEAQARSLVGDGKSPNIYFVTVSGKVSALFRDERLARDYAQLRVPTNVPVIIEDRKTGVVWENEVSLKAQRVED